jgi:hypothetical protein
VGDQDEFPVQRPARSGSWEIKARSKKIAEKWAEFTHIASGECQRVYDQLATNPLYEDGDRQHRLAGEAGRVTFKGVVYERRQIDVTSGGRIWYFVDPTPFGTGQRRRLGKVIIDEVLFGHPKATEEKPAGRKRPGRA